MVFVIIAFFVLYALLLVWLLWGWLEATRASSSSGITYTPFVSVILPVRNESLNILRITEAILQQQYASFELIVVDDHSTDKTLQLLENMRSGYERLTVIKSKGIGKKKAITTGIGVARGEIIITTDADCLPRPHWITAMVRSFEAAAIQMVVGPVAFAKPDSFFEKMQAVEFASLAGTTGAAIAWRMPLMCNGANLAFRKDAFQAVQGYEGNFDITSGDDEFLLRKISLCYSDGIAYASTPDAVVSTNAQHGVRQFIHQRLRWAGKWRYQTSWFSRGMAVFVLLSQFFFLITLVMVCGGSGSQNLLWLILSRWIMEGLFIGNVMRHTGQPFHLLAFIVLQFLYPVYVIGVGVFSLFFSFTWKDRTYQAVKRDFV